MTDIAWASKSSGGSFTSTEANEVKTAVNSKYDLKPSVTSIRTSDSPYSLSSAISVLRINCSSGSVIVNFLSGASTLARMIHCKNISTSTTPVVYTPSSSGQTIEGSTAYESTTSNEYMTFVPIGSTGYERIG